MTKIYGRRCMMEQIFAVKATSKLSEVDKEEVKKKLQDLVVKGSFDTDYDQNKLEGKFSKFHCSLYDRGTLAEAYQLAQSWIA